MDSQKDITGGVSYTASIVSLAAVETSSTPVRYSCVTSGAANINATDQNPGTWDYDISSGSPVVATGLTGVIAPRKSGMSWRPF